MTEITRKPFRDFLNKIGSELRGAADELPHASVEERNELHNLADAADMYLELVEDDDSQIVGSVLDKD